MKKGRPKHADILTPAEWKVSYAVRHGLTNQEIANLQNISLDGIKYHVANILKKLNLKNRKALKLWCGTQSDSPIFTQFSSESPKTHRLVGIAQISREVKNLQNSEIFYKNILGMTHLFTIQEMSFLECGGTRIMLTTSKQKNFKETIIYMKVENILDSFEVLTKRGVSFINPPHLVKKYDDGSEEWMAFFNDIEGRPLAIMACVK